MSLLRTGGDRLILYSNDCPKCKILKTKLDEKNIQYEVFSDVKEMVKKGMMSMPMLEDNGKIMTFFEAIKYIDNYTGVN